MALKDEEPITEKMVTAPVEKGQAESGKVSEGLTPTVAGGIPQEKGQAESGKVSEEEKGSDVSAARQQWIAEAAYYKARARGFEPGYEESDWLEAEQEYEQAHSTRNEG
jgi:hypothetical protein